MHSLAGLPMTETGEPGITETAGVRRHEVPERCRPKELLVWSGAGRGYLRRVWRGQTIGGRC